MKWIRFVKNNASNINDVIVAEMARQPDHPKAEHCSRSLMGMTLFMTNIGLAALVVWAWFQFGSINSAIGYLKGNRLIPDVNSISLGTVGPDENRTTVFTLKNMSARPIAILGARSSCSCVIADQMPITIQPRSTSPFRVTFHSGNQAREINQSIQLFTDSPLQPSLTLRLLARVANSSLQQNEEDPTAFGRKVAGAARRQ